MTRHQWKSTRRGLWLAKNGECLLEICFLVGVLAFCVLMAIRLTK